MGRVERVVKVQTGQVSGWGVEARESRWAESGGRQRGEDAER